MSGRTRRRALCWNYLKSMPISESIAKNDGFGDDCHRRNKLPACALNDCCRQFHRSFIRTLHADSSEQNLGGSFSEGKMLNFAKKKKYILISAIR